MCYNTIILSVNVLLNITCVLWLPDTNYEYLVYGYLLSSPTSYPLCVFPSNTVLARQPTLGTGIEPVTFRLTVERSNQLSYPSFISSFTSCLGSLPALGFEPRKHLQCILSAPPLTGLGYTGVCVYRKLRDLP